MEPEEKSPAEKPPEQGDPTARRLIGYLVGLAPAAFVLASGVDKYMQGTVKDSEMTVLYLVTAVCTLSAGTLFAKDADNYGSRVLAVVCAVAIALGFAALDACIVCAGCACQAMHKL